MSLRSEIRRLVEEGARDEAIMAELQCCRTAVVRAREAWIFETTPVDREERARRERIAGLTRAEIEELAERARVDRVTFGRVLRGARVRRSSVLLVERALDAAGRADLKLPDVAKRAATL